MQNFLGKNFMSTYCVSINISQKLYIFLNGSVYLVDGVFSVNYFFMQQNKNRIMIISHVFILRNFFYYVMTLGKCQLLKNL